MLSVLGSLTEGGCHPTATLTEILVTYIEKYRDVHVLPNKTLIFLYDVLLPTVVYINISR